MEVCLYDSYENLVLEVVGSDIGKYFNAASRDIYEYDDKEKMAEDTVSDSREGVKK